jgi:Na+/proline symporter
MITLTLTIGIMLLAMGETIEAVTQGAFHKNMIIVIVASIFLVYGILGGLTAAAVIDSIQGFLIVFLSFGIIPFMLMKIGGFSGLHEALDPAMFSLAAPKEMTLYVVLLFSLQAVVGTPGGPNVIPSYSASKNEMDARVGIVVGSIIKRTCTIGWVLMGLGAYAIFSDRISPEQADKVFGLAVRELLPPGLVGLMIAAMFAAVMSTCDATMVFAAGLFLKDVLPMMTQGRTFTSKQDIAITRIVSFFVVVAGILTAYIIPNIREGFIYLWQITLFTSFPFWCGIVWKRGTTAGAWASVIGTFLVWLVMEITMRGCFENVYVFNATEFLVCIPVGFGLFIMFSRLSKPEDCAKLDHFYTRLRTPIGTNPELDAL